MADANAPLNRMSAVDGLVLLGDVIPTLKAHQFIVRRDDGHWYFQKPGTGQIIAEGADVEALLKAHGLPVPPQVDRLIALLPALLPLLGVA